MLEEFDAELSDCDLDELVDCEMGCTGFVSGNSDLDVDELGGACDSWLVAAQSDFSAFSNGGLVSEESVTPFLPGSRAGALFLDAPESASTRGLSLLTRITGLCRSGNSTKPLGGIATWFGLGSFKICSWTSWSIVSSTTS